MPAYMEVLRQFSAARSPDSEERLRESSCALCGLTAGLGEEARERACDEARCGLRSPEVFRDETVWFERAFAGLILWPVPAETIELVNTHVLLHGCVTPTLVAYPDGTLGWELSALGHLRGALHRALLAFFTILGGHPIDARLSQLDLEELGQYRRQRQRERIRLLGRLGVPKKTIAARTNTPRSTVQRWLAEEDDGGVPKNG